jgi:geranylgeranyl pyrophosphate synthase
MKEAIVRLSQAGELSERGAAELTRALRRARRRRDKSEHDVAFLLSLLHKYGSVEYARAVARKRARRAAHTLERLDVSLSSGVHRDFLHGLTRFVVEREQ